MPATSRQRDLYSFAHPDRAVIFPIRTLETVRFSGAIYEADLSTLLDVLGECDPDAHRTMIVGHNPGLEYLLDHLAGGVPVPGDGKLLPTAALARLTLPGDWRRLKRGRGELLGLVRVRDLDD